MATNTEVWYWNDTIDTSSSLGEIIDFKSGSGGDELTYKAISIIPSNQALAYDLTAGEGQEADVYAHGQWVDKSARTITFLESPTGDLLNFLKANAVRLGSPGVSKVEYSGETLINLTADTITADNLAEGVTAHDSSGALIIGTATIPERDQRILDLDMASGNQVITPTNSMTLLDKVTIMKPTTMLPENIKKDVNIGGVVGTMEGATETWVLDRLLNCELLLDEEIQVSFTSNGNSYSSIKITDDDDVYCLKYDDTVVAGGNKLDLITFLTISSSEQVYDLYRKITFQEPITENNYPRLYAFFTEGGIDDSGNAISQATKQPPNQAIQTDKTVTITQNGTSSVTPNVPYDGLSKVDVTVNVDTPVSETWVWNENVSLEDGSNFNYNIKFESNGESYSIIHCDGIGGALQYYDKSWQTIYDTTWPNPAYRKITLLESPTGNLLTYLKANATKQPSDAALQPSKSVTITKNGTTTITPDTPYDGIQSVEVVGNVESSGGSGVTWYNPV